MGPDHGQIECWNHRASTQTWRMMMMMMTGCSSRPEIRHYYYYPWRCPSRIWKLSTHWCHFPYNHVGTVQPLNLARLHQWFWRLVFAIEYSVMGVTNAPSILVVVPNPTRDSDLVPIGHGPRYVRVAPKNRSKVVWALALLFWYREWSWWLVLEPRV